MNFDALKSALVVDGQGNLTIEKGTLTANIDDLISTCYFNIYNNNQSSIVIRNASLVINEGVDSNSIEVTGNSEFLKTNIAATGATLSVSGTFSLDDSGNVQMLLKYALLDDAPGPNDWKFSNSFSSLPTVTDYSKPVNSSAVLFLDEFYLYGASFVVSSEDTTDSATSAPLLTGINFVSSLKPQGALGIIESTFNQSQPLLVHGPIYLPQISQVVAPREPFLFPWQNTGIDKLPGIHLSVTLAKFTIGSNALDDFKFQAYTPISREWLENNESHTPLTCFTGGLSFLSNEISNESSSKDISIDLVAEYQLGATELYLVGVGHGLSIANLADMVNLVGSTDNGSSDSGSSLPDTLQPLVSALSEIELQSVGLGISLGHFPPTINYSMFSIGLSDVDWEIWEGHFAITRPFRPF